VGGGGKKPDIPDEGPFSYASHREREKDAVFGRGGEEPEVKREGGKGDNVRSGDISSS